MDEFARFRLVFIDVSLLLLGGWALFMEMARRHGRQAVAWHELPPSVRDSARNQLGDVVVLEITRGPTADRSTYRIRVSSPDNRRTRLWLAADGSSWPPVDPQAADVSETSPALRD